MTRGGNVKGPFDPAGAVKYRARGCWKRDLRPILIILLAGLLGTCSSPPALLDQVRDLGELRVVTRNSPTSYSVSPDGPTGPEYDLVQAFADELSGLVSHLAERLAGHDDGKPKVFRDSAVTNLLEFFERFQRLNIRSDEDLDRLVADARAVIGGFGPQQLRDQPAFRQHVAGELARIGESMESWMVARPRRNIMRRPR